MTPCNDSIIGVREAARILGVHENTVRNWQGKGILPAELRLTGSGYLRFSEAKVRQMRAEMMSSYAPADALPGEQR